MKKLTAGIFATLLAVVAVDGAYAAIASKQYVDDQVGEVESTVSTINTTVTELGDTINNADTGLGKQVKDLQTTTGQHTTQIGEIETALEGKVDDADIADMQIKGNMVGTAAWDANKTDDNKYPSAAAVNTAITAATTGIASEAVVEGIQTDLDAAEADIVELQTDKQDKNMGAEAANHVVITDQTGNITSAATIEAAKVSGLADVATSGAYDDLTGTPTLGALAGKDKVAAGDITAGAIAEADLNTTINASLDKADTAVQPSAIIDMQVKANLTKSAGWEGAKTSEDKYPSNAAVNAAITSATSGLATDSKMGDLSTLTTTEKTNLVGAINEVDANADAAKTAADAAQEDATQAIAGAATAQETAEAAQTTAEARIPKPTGACSNPTAKCVLVSNGTNSFEWEVIERGTGEAGAQQ